MCSAKGEDGGKWEEKEIRNERGKMKEENKNAANCTYEDRKKNTNDDEMKSGGRANEFAKR